MPDYSSRQWTVGFGAATISAASAAYTGAYAIVKSQPRPGLLALSSGLNGGWTGALFFLTREYAISPLLDSKSKNGDEGDSRITSPEPQAGDNSFTDLRFNKTVDTALAGSITGGVLRGLNSGRRAIIPGALTAGAISTLLQLAFNQFSISRLRYMAKLKQENRTVLERPGSFPRSSSTEPSTEEPSFWTRIFTPTPDEERIARMKKARDIYLKRIAELEKQIEEEKIAKEIMEEMQALEKNR